MRTLKTLLLALGCVLASQLVAGELHAFKEASLPCHRLPISVKPTSYDLALEFPSLDSEVYEGSVEIAVRFSKSDSKKLAAWGLEGVLCASQSDENTIVLHADKSLEIKDIKVTSQSSLGCFSGCSQKERKIVELVRDEAKQMIAIKVKDGIHSSSNGKVQILFRGRLRNDKRGVYLSTYNDGKQIYKHIVSQFQPTFARTVFPCFDEPRFRVPFSVRVSHPKGLTAYGNTEVEAVSDEGDLTLTRFATTPDMPVHMVAFTIGHFDEPLEVELGEHIYLKDPKVKKIRVITAPGKKETAQFALEVAKESIEWIEKQVYDFPLGKLDVIAIADLDKDNTGSWGLVFVRDNLLWVDDETMLESKFTTALNIAHVVAHQWFGSLVSVNWWSDLWITEGMAAQTAFKFIKKKFEYEYIHERPVRSESQSEFFLRSTLSDVLQADQAGNLHPLSPSEENLQTSEQIYGIFNHQQFMKSAAMVKMVEETFAEWEHRELLTNLFEKHAYKTFNFKDYQRLVLSRKTYLDPWASERLLDMLNTFPKFSGVPVVNCRLNTARDEIRLDLESFANAGRDIDRSQSLQHPLAIKVGTAAMSSISSRYHNQVQILCSNRRNYRELPDWCKPYDSKTDSFVKVDLVPSIATYYRTRYTDELYERLQVAIEKKVIPAISRVHILDDANSLVQARLISMDRFKSLMDSFVNEDDPAVVPAILTATNTYRRLSPDGVSSLRSNNAIMKLWDRYAQWKVNDDNLIQQRAHRAVLLTLIQQGHEYAIKCMLEAFDEYTYDGELFLYLREPFYKVVVLSGSSERVNKLLSHLLETKSYEEQIHLVKALTLSKDKDVLTKVKSWIETSGLKKETTKPFLETISAALSQ